MAIGRPPLRGGTYGEISVSEVASGKYKARARYRDRRTGKLHYVARFADTKGKARAALKDALAEWQDAGGQALTRSTTLAALAKEWLAECDASDRSTNTKQLYRYAVDRYVVPYLGQVRIGEATAGVCDAALTRLGTEIGKGAAKTTRAVLNGMFGLAVRHGAATVNPIRETRPISSTAKAARALTDEEADRVKDFLRSDERAVLLDLPDLVEFGLFTGCRIGEALAIRETVLDLDAGTVEINATAIRVKGVGMVIQEKPKTAAGWRVLALPPFAVDMLRRRREEIRLNPPAVKVLGPDGKIREERTWLAFPAPLARSIRDPSNTAGDLREALDRIDRDDELADEPGPFRWVTYHTFRKTVATWLDRAGMTPRQIADQLGHSQPSMTQDRYMGRRVVSAEAAAVLNR